MMGVDLLRSIIKIESNLLPIEKFYREDAVLEKIHDPKSLVEMERILREAGQAYKFTKIQMELKKNAMPCRPNIYPNNYCYGSIKNDKDGNFKPRHCRCFQEDCTSFLSCRRGEPLTKEERLQFGLISKQE